MGGDALQLEKTTVGLASHWPCVTDNSGSPPTGSRPRRGRWAPAYALLVEYGKFHLLPYMPITHIYHLGSFSMMSSSMNVFITLQSLEIVLYNKTCHSHIMLHHWGQKGGAENAVVENAGVENVGVDRRGGKCRSDNVWKAEITSPFFEKRLTVFTASNLKTVAKVHNYLLRRM